MPSVGPILRGARLQAGLTLEHISVQTRIPVKILHALEEDDLHQFTSAFFYKSFVRQFAQKVSLPYETVAEAVAEQSKIYPDTFGPRQLQTVVQHAVVKTRKRSINLRSWFAAGSAALLLVGCSTLYSYWEGVSDTSLASTKKWFAGLLPASGKAEASMAKAESNVPPASLAGEQDNSFHVEVSAIEASWLSIVADGRQTFSGVLERAQRKVFEGRDNGRVRTGNAGGLKVVFNGKPVGIVGPRGQVRIVVFTKDNYEVLEPARAESAALASPEPINLLATRWTVNSSGERSEARPYSAR